MQEKHNVEQQINLIDLHDAQIQHIEMTSGEMLMTIKNWQEKILLLRFKGLVFFKALGFGSDISEVRIEFDTREIKEALHVIVIDGGATEDHPNLVQITFMHESADVIVVFQEFRNESRSF